MMLRPWDSECIMRTSLFSLKAFIFTAVRKQSRLLEVEQQCDADPKGQSDVREQE